MGSPIQIQRPINYIILVPIFFKWTPPIREKVATILLFRLFSGQQQWSGWKTSSSSCVNPSFSSILGPFWFTELLLFYRSVAAFDCMRVIHPLLPLPLSSGQWLVTYFAGIFPCSAAALHRAYTSFVRLTNPDQPTHQPVTHRCCGCAGNRIPGTTKYIANRRHRTKGSCDAHQRSTPIRGCWSRWIEEIRDAKR